MYTKRNDKADNKHIREHIIQTIFMLHLSYRGISIRNSSGSTEILHLKAPVFLVSDLSVLRKIHPGME